MGYSKPVSLHFFNRPDHARELLGLLSNFKPLKVYVTVDGPRDNNSEDLEKTNEIKCLIDNVIDWDCVVEKNYPAKNLGSYGCTTAAINWVFSREDEAVFLEDDSRPSASFFTFCEQLLDRYRHDDRVGAISGNNFQLSGMNDYPHSYYYSAYNHIWGWATWKRAWNKLDLDIPEWPEYRKYGFEHDYPGGRERRWWGQLFDALYEKKKNHWDYKFKLSMRLHSMLAIVPSVNLVSNVGWGDEAAHTRTRTRFMGLPAKEMDFPLRHPSTMYINHGADEYTENNIFSGQSGLINKILRNIGLKGS